MATWNGKGLEPFDQVLARGRAELAKLAPEAREAKLAELREKFLNIGKVSK